MENLSAHTYNYYCYKTNDYLYKAQLLKLFYHKVAVILNLVTIILIA